MLAGRPVHLPAAKEVGVQVIDALAAILALVDDKTVAAGESLLFGDLLRRIEDMAVITILADCRKPGNFMPGGNHNMNRRLGLDVAEGDDMIVFVNDSGRDFPVDNLREDASHL